MEPSLETTVKETPSLRQEISESIRHYPSTLVKYGKTLGPAILIASVGSATAQLGAQKLGFDTPSMMTAAAYLGGYVPGYCFFFGREYYKNKDCYPNGMLSKGFGEYVASFFAADYLADITTFTPAFIFSNIWLTNHTSLNPFSRGLLAWNGCALPYLAAMAALHPVTKRATEAVNKGIVSLVSTVKSRFTRRQ